MFHRRCCKVRCCRQWWCHSVSLCSSVFLKCHTCELEVANNVKIKTTWWLLLWWLLLWSVEYMFTCVTTWAAGQQSQTNPTMGKVPQCCGNFWIFICWMLTRRWKGLWQTLIPAQFFYSYSWPWAQRNFSLSSFFLFVFEPLVMFCQSPCLTNTKFSLTSSLITIFLKKSKNQSSDNINDDKTSHHKKLWPPHLQFISAFKFSPVERGNLCFQGTPFRVALRRNKLGRSHGGRARPL